MSVVFWSMTCDVRAVLPLMPKVEVPLRHRSEISLPSSNFSPKNDFVKCLFKHQFEEVGRSRISGPPGSFTLATHSHVLVDGAPMWVHAASASCVCVLCPPPECAWCQPAGHVVYLTQNRTPLMFQRMEPPPEGGGTEGQGGQGVDGLPSTQPDNINSMWVHLGGGAGGAHGLYWHDWDSRTHEHTHLYHVLSYMLMQ